MGAWAQRCINIVFFVVAGFIMACNNNNLVDTNESIPHNNWEYRQAASANVMVKDSLTRYSIRFKLRHTASYRYGNLYALVKIKGPGLNKTTRYQFKLAQSDGLWLGKGSGDIYEQSFPLLTDFSFPKRGNYQLEVEQNMRDNPLTGISDVGISVAQVR